MADGHITVTVNARADEVQGLLAEVDRLRGLAERAADMLTAYGELIRRDGASHVEEHHYLPEVEHTARELRECALGPNVRVEPTPKAVGSNEGLCARNEKRGNDD